MYLTITLVISFLYLFTIFYCSLKRRYIFLKPSVIALSFYFVLNIVPALLLSATISDSLSNPYELLFVNSIIPYLLLLFFCNTDLLPSRAIYTRIINLNPIASKLHPWLLLSLSFLSFTLLYYSSKHTLASTGLFVLFSDPLNALISREESFTYITDNYILYLLNLSIVTLLPFTGGLLFQLARTPSYHKIFRKLFLVLIYIFLLAFASIYGARGPAVYLLISTLYSLFLLLRPSKLLPMIIFSSALSLLPAFLISFAYNTARGFSVVEIILNILSRTFFRGFESTIFWFEYLQNNSYFGISAIPKLSVLFGIPSFDPAVKIFDLYHPDSRFEILGQASANTFVQYYAIFGIPGLLLTATLLRVLDFIVKSTSTLPNILLLPTYCALASSAIYISFSQLNTVIVSKGYLLILFFIFIHSILSSKTISSS